MGTSNNLIAIIADAEVSLQIEEEQELSPVSTPVKDVPFVSKSELNEEWVPMKEINQFQTTGKLIYFIHLSCPNNIQISKKYYRTLKKGSKENFSNSYWMWHSNQV